jgi:hypothetical protein
MSAMSMMETDDLGDPALAGAVDLVSVGRRRSRERGVPEREGWKVLPVAVLLGAVSAQSVRIVGALYLGEVLALLFIVAHLGRLRLSRPERLLVVFAVLWSSAQVCSDLLNLTAAADSVKGVLAPLLFVSTIVGLGAYFRERVARIASFMLGAAFGVLVSEMISPSAYFAGNPWKWGLGGVVLTVGLLYYSFLLRREHKMWAVLAILLFFMTSLYFGARSTAVLTLLAVVSYVGLASKRGKRFLRFFCGRWGPARLVPVVVVLAVGLNAGLTALSTSEILVSRVSASTAQSYARQAGGEFGILLGGRSEIFVSAQAFLDKPLFGHGSWAKDNVGYTWRMAQRAYSLGYTESAQQFDRFGLIPAHSFLMGALVWSGILGGVFWLALLQIVLRSFLDVRGRLPLYFYAGVTFLLWDVFFSPFGASPRWATGAFLAAFLAYTRCCGARARGADVGVTA